MPELTLRPATAGDIPAVLAFWQAAAENADRPADTAEAVAALIARAPDALLLALAPPPEATAPVAEEPLGGGPPGRVASGPAGGVASGPAGGESGGPAGGVARGPAGGESGVPAGGVARGPAGGMADEDPAIVGTVIAGWDGWRCHLYRLAVSPHHRRRGIGQALIAAAEERFRAFGGIRVDAMVLDDNVQAHHVWQAAGYSAQAGWSRWLKPLPDQN